MRGTRLIFLLTGILFFTGVAGAEITGFGKLDIAETGEVAGSGESDLGRASAVAQAPDSAAFAALDVKLEEYTAAISGEEIGVQCGEADFLISSCQDSLVRQHVALWLYAHYIGSGIMGIEGVAVHIFDEWFSDGKVAMLSEVDLMNARIYAEFNRRSLLGCVAPPLSAVTAEGERASFPSPGRYSLLYFYDLSCSECKLQSVLLKAYLSEEDPDLDFYAFCVGQDEDAWREYTDSRLDFDTSSMRVFHLWDPSVESDYQMKYGVLKTPRLFLVDRQGVIIGRGLDVTALKQMLDMLPDLKPYNYGKEESVAFFEEIFGMYGSDVSVQDVQGMARQIGRSTIETGDTLAFKHIAGDMLYWLSGKRGEAYREGAGFVADTLILGRPEVWYSHEDSLLVVGLAGLTHELFSRTPVGSRLPSIRVRGVLHSAKGTSEGLFSLDKLRGDPSYIIFHSPGCEFCQAELSAVDSLLAANPGAKVLTVDMSALSGSPVEEQLLAAFDLTILPLVIETSSKGIVRRRHMSFL